MVKKQINVINLCFIDKSFIKVLPVIGFTVLNLSNTKLEPFLKI